MKILLHTGVLTLLIGVFLFTGVSPPQRAAAQDDESVINETLQEENQSEDVESEDVESENSVVYEYTAQLGDSYSLLARKAVQTYGLKEEVSLTRSQIIYAETHMTQVIGSPLLEVSEAISIRETAVKQWVDKALELSEAEESAWAVFAVDANLNTDSVGESQ